MPSCVVMDPSLGERGRKIGEMLIYAYFGPYGMREIGECLRIWKKQLEEL